MRRFASVTPTIRRPANRTSCCGPSTRWRSCTTRGGNDRVAVRLLRELIDRYDTPEAAGYAPAPRILALRVIEELQPGSAAEEAGAAS